MRILAVGSTPPPIDGQSLAFSSAMKSFQQDHKVKHIQTSFRGKTSLSILYLPLLYLYKLVFFRLVFKPNAIYFVCSRTLIGSIRDLLLLIVYRNSSALVINHIHGSNFIDFVNSLPVFYKKILLYCYSRVDINVALSISMKLQLEDLQQFKNRVVIVNNFYEDIPDKLNINDDKFSYNPLPIKLVYLSGMCTTKGIFDLIKSSEILSSRNIRHTLSIAGKGINDAFLNAKDVEKKVISSIAKLESIEYLGLVTGAEKYKLLERSHVFILPTYYESEAIPLSIIEAMRMGCVIITTNYKYLPDLVKQNVNGYLVRIKNIDDIVDAVIHIYNNSLEFEKISTYNKEYAISHYSECNYRMNVIKLISNDYSI